MIRNFILGFLLILCVINTVKIEKIKQRSLETRDDLKYFSEFYHSTMGACKFIKSGLCAPKPSRKPQFIAMMN